MNCVSIIPDLTLHGLQLQNIKRNTVKITKKYNINQPGVDRDIDIATEKKVLPQQLAEITNKIERTIPTIPNNIDLDTTTLDTNQNQTLTTTIPSIPSIPESSIAFSSTNISDLSSTINL
jgi:hypothetical protein